MRQRETRREFLQVPAAGDVLPSGRHPPQRSQCDRLRGDGGPIVMQFSRRAMASQFEIRLPVAAQGTAGGRNPDAELAVEALEAMDVLEEQLSFFRPTSELNRINRLAAEGPVEVEPELFRLLCLAKDIWRDTEGRSTLRLRRCGRLGDSPPALDRCPATNKSPRHFGASVFNLWNLTSNAILSGLAGRAYG